MNKLKIIIPLTTITLILIIAGINMKSKAKKENKSLRKKLTPLQYHVTQECGTEAPFKNKYWNNKEPGIYVDIVSGEVLFSSLDKYNSGTGWPSFTRSADDKNIVKKTDNKLVIPRIEVRSKKGNSHLGHVFNDGPAPTGLRYCINSAALRFIPVKDLEKEGYGKYLSLFKKSTKDNENQKQGTIELEAATFAAGCFWGVEHIFKKIPGVVSTTVGYTGGETKDPNYEDVSTGRSGHAEAILIKYNPEKVTYKELLDYFWRLHDPTTFNRQGLDVGSQYRSAIFYHNKKQKKIAEQSKNEFDSKKVFNKKAVTQIVPAAKFFTAEEYHQDFYTKSNRPICHILRDR